MKNLSLLLISILFLSCQKRENATIPKKENNATPIDSSITIGKEKKEQENIRTGDTIFMNTKNKENQFVAKSSLDSINSRIYIKFKNEDSAELNAKIIPATGKGNIRFNQIISPDKNSDGPFGMELKIPLKQKGHYILVIGHSLMADNPYYGKFKVQLEMKNNPK